MPLIAWCKSAAVLLDTALAVPTVSLLALSSVARMRRAFAGATSGGLCSNGCMRGCVLVLSGATPPVVAGPYVVGDFNSDGAWTCC